MQTWRELRPPLAADEALLEADRCLECGGPYAEAPCTLACPAGVDVPGFVSALAAGEAEQAARKIYDANILGATCARVCPVEVLCEGACVYLNWHEKPIEIAYKHHAKILKAVIKRDADAIFSLMVGPMALQFPKQLQEAGIIGHCEFPAPDLRIAGSAT